MRVESVQQSRGTGIRGSGEAIRPTALNSCEGDASTTLHYPHRYNPDFLFAKHETEVLRAGHLFFLEEEGHPWPAGHVSFIARGEQQGSEKWQWEKEINYLI
jgi:hypothetical protein